MSSLVDATPCRLSPAPSVVAATHAPRIHAARACDVSAMLPLWRQMMAEHLRLHQAFALADDAEARWQEGIVDMLGRPEAFVWVARSEEDAVVGFCNGWSGHNPAIYAARRIGLISELCVAQTARRHGVGRALVLAARGWFVRRDLEEFQLSTAVNNAAGRAFWRAMGGDELLVRFRFSLHA